ncbi:hypothetical protein A2U01_0047059, partial [Trifolium medium]|nr:hypothetical protein [Trifolium medium]
METRYNEAKEKPVKEIADLKKARKDDAAKLKKDYDDELAKARVEFN